VITPLPANWRYPAEWEPHHAVWLAWPFHLELWQENLPQAQKEFVSLVQTLNRHEKVKLLCHNAKSEEEARNNLTSVTNIDFHQVPYGDIWVRDTGCLFFVDQKKSSLAAKTFSFNGWGEKYTFPEDLLVAKQMATLAGSSDVQSSQWIVEGGALEWDGEGTVLTTRQCLLNKNRKHPKRQDEAAFEETLKQELGVSSVAWITEGLLNDHTDGHIDTIARFIAPGVVICMESSNSEDPQKAQLRSILDDLKNVRLQNGKKLEIFTIPSPGAVLDEDGGVMPASYMNFYLGNNMAVVPTYQSRQDDLALKALEPLIKNRNLYPLPSLAILSGGGSFHCITQQEPKV
jgi:agmatine deiminase